MERSSESSLMTERAEELSQSEAEISEVSQD